MSIGIKLEMFSKYPLHSKIVKHLLFSMMNNPLSTSSRFQVLHLQCVHVHTHRDPPSTDGLSLIPFGTSCARPFHLGQTLLRIAVKGCTSVWERKNDDVRELLRRPPGFRLCRILNLYHFCLIQFLT